MTWQDDIVWRNTAHAEGRSTNLDGIPAWTLRLIHYAWATQDFTKTIRTRLF